MLALLSLVIPVQVEATNTASIEFKIDNELSKPKYVLGPFKSELPVLKPKPKIKVATAKVELAKLEPSYCSCVSFAKSKTGFTKSVGLAKNWPRNSVIPVVGGVAISRESSAGHVMYITAVRDGEFDYTDANRVRCKLTTGTMKINNPILLGFWKP